MAAPVSELTRVMRAQKGALTRAKKQGPYEVILAVRDAYGAFTGVGWPDCWSLWQRAFDDALWDLRREDPAWLEVPKPEVLQAAIAYIDLVGP